MPQLDRREPGVYVDIEDRSYVAPVIESGRIVYGVTLCDRGPSDQIVHVTSQKQFHEIFGKPNFIKTSQVHYQLDQALKYTSNVLVTRVVPEDSYLSNVYIKENQAGEVISGEFMFTNNLNEIRIMPEKEEGEAAVYGSAIYGTNEFGLSNSDEISKFIVGSWIYAELDSPEVAAQITNIVTNGETGELTFTLDRKYEGSTTIGNALKFLPYEFSSLADVDTPDLFVNPDGDVVYYFYANGCGKYYNKLSIRGTRNTDLEKLFVNEETGETLYKYMFMDVGVYEKQPNGNQKLIEGPWTVSLIPRYPDNIDQLIQDPVTGRFLYIEEVINSESNFIRCVASIKDPVTDEPNSEFPAVNRLISSANSEQKRLQIMLMFSPYTPIGTQNIAASSNGVRFENGTDGTGLYNTAGNIQANDKLLGKVAQAYNGTLTKNGVDQIREELYPVYQPDYLVCGGYPAYVIDNANELVTARGDCICLADTGSFVSSYDKDLKARKDDVPWNSFYSMIYIQYRRVFDDYTGRKFWASPVYHAIAKHLQCDANYFLAEPCAGILKGAIEEPIVLAYKANHVERGDLGDAQLNLTIDEPQGKYIHTQLTAFKQLSVLRNGHVVKFVCYLKKVIPTILKDLLHHKATPFWINQAQLRMNSLLNKFINGPVERYSILNKFDVTVTWDDSSQAIDVLLNIYPIRSIERINVTIAVH